MGEHIVRPYGIIIFIVGEFNPRQNIIMIIGQFFDVAYNYL